MKKRSILWYPKKWKNFQKNPEKVYATSNRVRAYNFHESIKSLPDLHSEIADYSLINPDPFSFDIIVCQKNILPFFSSFKLSRFYGKLVVLDMCDPVSSKFYRHCHHFLDLIITSNYELTELAKSEGLKVPIETVVDSHEVYNFPLKEHHPKDKIKVTWYGVGVNYFHFVQNLAGLLDSNTIDFAWASNDDPSYFKEKGYTKGVQFEMDWRIAEQEKYSWQNFIHTSDVGIVPVTGAKIKSPHKVLNYMAHGIPVVCSPTDAHKRIIQHGINGFFAETSDDWNKYLNMLKDYKLRNKMGIAGRNMVFETYSVKNVSNLYY
ncbi:group 1 glycosyl transferase, partial [Candidatus Magnetomorum sp. HK-1]